MNKTVLLLRSLKENPSLTQRELAQMLDVSLGTANALIAEAKANGWYDKPDAYLKPYKVDNAVIMAAGFGSRFVPLTWETPKGLLEVFGERMLERQIKQLHEAGIRDITIVVGYLKEKFDYLIDKYDVKLIYNPDYSRMNNISTLYAARKEFLGHNTYLLNSDNWLRRNMYHAYEPCAWYSSAYMNGPTGEWCLDFNKKGLITNVTIGGSDSYVMFGPIYFSKEFSERFFPEVERYYHTPGREQDYWENIYVDWIRGERGFDKKTCPEMYINKQPDDQVYEFENLEELRAFDDKYLRSSDNEAMSTVAGIFNVPESEIHDIHCLKAGMTNRSFEFALGDKQYICRIPGEGTSELINRREEGDNFDAVKSLGITENIVYFDKETGYKITEYYPDARVADATNADDVKRCMKLLRSLHESGITVGHDFDIEERINFYEKLCLTHGGIPFEDYFEVRKNAQKLIDELKNNNHKKAFSHIDAVPDNFLFINNVSDLKLIDWEYSGMADPLIDLAMWTVYSYYDKSACDKLIDAYVAQADANAVKGADDNICGALSDAEIRRTVYAYVALAGLLWALWAIYKSQLGVTFGDYTLIQYRYAKTFYKYCFS